MTLSSILGVFVGVIALFMFVIPTFLVVKRNGKGPTPLKISYGILGLLVINWLFFLTGAYSLLPVNVADLIFVPVWLVLCLIGVIAAVNEFRNNKAFAIPVAGLTTISFLFSLFASGISQM
ncbi:hypothetical protein [Halobacillus naozhouensis]|uniref:Uncharacterized protein n=1 Tax=Halobacillus naozhouensis TaxID=554880 RepID=A0ABY8J507_9BACI|nr:hypothetical protein [Halobacillus naozhouensis]WFT76524.1 hypothetical protein P9989_09240 [Halobacillus naozhouensis]